MSTVIPIGPYHPALKEGELFKLIAEGEEIVDVKIRIGYNHRGIEKLAEKLTYDQTVFLVERICGICSNIHPLCFVQAVEDIANIEVPDRARFIRVIIAEMERIHSHLLWFGVAGHILGFDTLLMWAWKARELILDRFEEITGNRQHYAMNVIGGVRKDLTIEEASKLSKSLKELKKLTNSLIDMIASDSMTLARLKGIGILTKHDARNFCGVGPIARASGLNIDVRKDNPYAAYKNVSFNIPVFTEGDVWAKAYVRLLETLESISIIEQALGSMPSGAIKADKPEIPVGEGIGLGEAPRGEDIHYLITSEDGKPWRLKVRSPTVVNAPSLTKMLPGYTLADAVIIIGGIDPCFCCNDRIITINRKNEEIVDYKKLLQLCRKKYGGKTI
ncbi:MAG: nickel-dependent hydrogenase large subunit [Candidatus Bathyarchaeia archaeon]